MPRRVLNIKRKPYRGKRVEGPVDPLTLFRKWFKEAINAVPGEPNAMALATTGKNGQPSVRIVLLKSFDKKGFVFFTSFLSRKATELKQNPKASLCFYWAPLHLQVRIEGKIKKVSAKDADTYFRTRPRGSQIAASISQQSHPLDSYESLTKKFLTFEVRNQKQPIKRPAFWGGYCLEPTYFEFWSGKTTRLHERLSYKKGARGWKQVRLYP